METNAEIYEQDLARWGMQTAAFLREGKTAEVDLAAVAEELESLGSGDAHRLWKLLREMLVWFLAWNYAPTQRVKHPHWYVRVTMARCDIEVILDVSPSLAPKVAANLAKAYAYAREVASEETGLPLETFPQTCLWTAAQVVRSTFWPMGNHEFDTTP
jgi:hypothetical protein